jgi:hypothetical protein
LKTHSVQVSTANKAERQMRNRQTDKQSTDKQTSNRQTDKNEETEEKRKRYLT